MKSLWSKINSPLPGWLTLILLCGTLTAHAALPSFSASWITANAAATPSPAVTGFYGPAVIAQATAAPTAQPGGINVTKGITSGTLFSNIVGTTNNDYQWMCAAASTICDLGQNSSASFAGVSGSVLCINNGTNASGGVFTCLDISGDWGATSYNTTHAEVNQNGTIFGSSNGAASTYLPPVYTAAGVAVASTLHGVFGTWTCSTATITGVGLFVCQSSASTLFTNAAAFTSATSFGCNETVTSISNTGTLTYTEIPGFGLSFYPSTNGSAGALFGAYINTSVDSVNGIVTMNGTYFCYGT
jgi:hypothetical protein